MNCPIGRKQAIRCQFGYHAISQTISPDAELRPCRTLSATLAIRAPQCYGHSEFARPTANGATPARSNSSVTTAATIRHSTTTAYRPCYGGCAGPIRTSAMRRRRLSSTAAGRGGCLAPGDQGAQTAKDGRAEPRRLGLFPGRLPESVRGSRPRLATRAAAAVAACPRPCRCAGWAATRACADCPGLVPLPALGFAPLPGLRAPTWASRRYLDRAAVEAGCSMTASGPGNTRQV
jgi:hypothetical protein